MVEKRYRAVLDDSEPGGPGGGGPNSTLSYDQLPKSEWCTTIEEAQQKGNEMNRERGYDWFVTIEEKEI